MTYLLPTAETWEQWSAIFSDMALWRPVVSEICSKERITYSRIEMGYSGTEAVLLLDRKYVIKIYNPIWKDFSVEWEVLTALGQEAEIPVPKIVSSGRFADRIEWDYLITEFLEGTPIRELRNSLGQKDLNDIATRLGEIVQALHDTDLTDLESVKRHDETGSQLAQHRKVEVVAEIRKKALLPDDVLDNLESFLETASIEFRDHPAVPVHGDLTEHHLLLKRHGDRWGITGLLDFGDAHACPREYEWPALWLNLLRRDTEALRAFFDSYNRTVLEDEDFTRRAFVWTLFHDFGTEMIEDALTRRDGPSVRSVQDLREVLWPNNIRAI